MKGIALCIYKVIHSHNVSLPGQAAVETCLKSLNPGEQAETLMRDYYTNKIKLILWLLVLGVVAGILAKIMYLQNSVVSNNALLRGEFDEGKKTYILQAGELDSNEKLEVEVWARELTTGELVCLAEEFFKNPEEYILGDNESLKEVWSDLRLYEQYDGLPFEIEWVSDNRDVIDSDGCVSECLESQNVILEATLIYEDFEYSGEITVEVAPTVKSPAEQQRMEIQDFLTETEKNSRRKKEVMLPKEWKGEEIQWKFYIKDYSMYIGVLTPVILCVIYFSYDKDLYDQREKRKKKLLYDYPNLVHKLVLYTGAGMSLRGAIHKMCTEYEKEERSKKKREGYEELSFTYREIRSGVPEGIAYERLGKRVGLREYIRLGTLLNQNLKRGDTSFRKRMEEEIVSASEETLRQSKKLGEEAETKLLLPMIIMLGIVMLLILIPAFGTL